VEASLAAPFRPALNEKSVQMATAAAGADTSYVQSLGLSVKPCVALSDLYQSGSIKRCSPITASVHGGSSATAACP
jgi:hypothetical protein